MIIDVHTHIGRDRVFDVIIQETELLDACNQNGIEIALVQPLVDSPDLETSRKAHDQVAAFARANPGRIYGIASMSPHIDGYEAEITRCVKELGFVGVKLSPDAHACSPTTADGRRVFQIGRELGIPVMVHTGSGIPASAPALLLPIAKEFADVKIIMAHGGANILSGEAMIVAQECPNISIDATWCGAHVIAGFIKKLGSGRVMFASDMPSNIPVELVKFRTIHLTPDEMEDCMWRTAARVFNLPVRG